MAITLYAGGAAFGRPKTGPSLERLMAEIEPEPSLGWASGANQGPVTCVASPGGLMTHSPVPGW